MTVYKYNYINIIEKPLYLKNNYIYMDEIEKWEDEDGSLTTDKIIEEKENIKIVELGENRCKSLFGGEINYSDMCIKYSGVLNNCDRYVEYYIKPENLNKLRKINNTDKNTYFNITDENIENQEFDRITEINNFEDMVVKSYKCVLCRNSIKFNSIDNLDPKNKIIILHNSLITCILLHVNCLDFENLLKFSYENSDKLLSYSL